MIGDNWYNQDIRKATVAFGALFNNISFIKNDVNRDELKRIKVPLGYGSKEKYLALLQADPEDKAAVAIQLPRMSFELTGMGYDKTRAQTQMLQDSSAIVGNATHMSTKYVPAPYDLQFSLHVMTREVDDGLQIIEQVVQYFRPDYTVSINFDLAMGQIASKDTPIILDSIEVNDSTTPVVDEIRIIVWTLSFTMKSYLFGPTRTQGQIMHVFVNYYDNTVMSRPLTVNGIVLTANTTRGSNTVVLSANGQSVISANDIIKLNDSVITVSSISGNTVSGNVHIQTTEKLVTVETMISPNTRVAAYIANVVPPTALITDNYTISELFQDFV